MVETKYSSTVDRWGEGDVERGYIVTGSKHLYNKLSLVVVVVIDCIRSEAISCSSVGDTIFGQLV